MKKNVLAFLFMALLASISTAWADVSSYTFTSAVQSYSEISGGNVVATATANGSGATALDSYNATLPDNTIPFTFHFNGYGYTGLTINSNGYITFGATVPSTSNTSPISGSTSYDGSISAMGLNLQASVNASALGEIRYTTVGTEPNREFVIQYKNFRRTGSSFNSELLNFQIRLSESNNNIKIVYGTYTISSTTSGTAQVGLRGLANTDYYNRSTTTNWAATTAGTSKSATCTFKNTVYPANGLNYTFTPPTPTAVPNNATAVLPTDSMINVYTNSNLTWSDGGGWTAGYYLYFGTDNPPTDIVHGLDIGYTNSYDPTGDLTPLTTYYWQIRPYNSIGTNTSTPIWSFTVSEAPISGTRVIGLNGDYESITEAINALNNAGVGENGVQYHVLANSIFDENPPELRATGSDDRQIVFSKYGDGANPVIRPLGTADSNDFGIKINAADYIVFDGIDIENQSGTDLEYGYWVAGSDNDGCKHITIMNSRVKLDASNTNSKGIYVSSSASNTDSSNDYCLLYNNTIKQAYNGIYFSGSSTAGREDRSNEISTNAISDCMTNSIYVQYAIDCNIHHSTIVFPEGATNTLYGIYIKGNTTTATIENNVISDGSSSNSIYGVYISSASATSINDNQMLNFTCTGTSAVYGINSSGTNTDMLRNMISNCHSGGSLYGIYSFAGSTANAIGNKIQGLYSSTTGTSTVTGISTSGTTYNVVNNMISNLQNPDGTSVPQVRGIYSNASGLSVMLYYNSVFLSTSGSNTNFSSAAVFNGVSLTSVVMKNNIFMNTSTAGAAGFTVASYRNGTSVANVSNETNNNIYYAGVPSNTNLIYYDGTSTYSTLSSYQSAYTGFDQGSFTEEVPFISIANLHMNPTVATIVEGGAIVITSVTTDIDGNSRNTTTPDIGADEGNFTSFVSSIDIPTNVRIIIADNSVILNWDAVNSATSYKVYSADVPNATANAWTLVGTYASNSATILNIQGQKKFYYVIAER